MARRILCSWQVGTTVFLAGLVGCGQEPAPGTLEAASGLSAGTALFVVGNTALGAGDRVIGQRLQAAGLTVVVKGDSAAVAGDAAGKSLVVISSTVTSGLVGSKFTSGAVPVLAWESALFDDLQMTAVRSGTDFGTVTSQQQLVIAAPTTDPMTAGLTGTQTVVSTASTFSWGKPGSAAVVVARTAADATRSAIFRYERGAPMVGINAPERRVGFMLGDSTASVLTVAGQSLTDAAIRWASHLDPGCVPGTTTCNGSVLRTCDANGNWSLNSTCQFVCSAGACTGNCKPGTTTCNGSVLKTCDANGNWSLNSTCQFVCSAGACTGNCKPGTTTCNGSVLQTCDANGNWSLHSNCQFVCSAGAHGELQARYDDV